MDALARRSRVLLTLALCATIHAEAQVDHTCEFDNAGDGCIFDLNGNGSGSLAITTRAQTEGDHWRVTLVEVGVGRARTELGTGSSQMFSGPVSQHVKDGVSYEAIVTYEQATSMNRFPTSVDVRFEGPVLVSGPRTAPPSIGPGVYVDGLLGNDANAGTKVAPLATIAAGIAMAAPTGDDVHVAGWHYQLANSLDLVEDVSIIGGYDHSWTLSIGAVTEIDVAQPIAVRAQNTEYSESHGAQRPHNP